MTKKEFIIFIKSLGFEKDKFRISSVYEYYTYKHFCKIAIYGDSKHFYSFEDLNKRYGFNTTIDDIDNLKKIFSNEIRSIKLKKILNK